jgi:hypothetical protein
MNGDYPEVFTVMLMTVPKVSIVSHHTTKKSLKIKGIAS